MSSHVKILNANFSIRLIRGPHLACRCARLRQHVTFTVAGISLSFFIFLLSLAQLMVEVALICSLLFNEQTFKSLAFTGSKKSFVAKTKTLSAIWPSLWCLTNCWPLTSKRSKGFGLPRFWRYPVWVQGFFQVYILIFNTKTACSELFFLCVITHFTHKTTSLLVVLVGDMLMSQDATGHWVFWVGYLVIPGESLPSKQFSLRPFAVSLRRASCF